MTEPTPEAVEAVTKVLHYARCSAFCAAPVRHRANFNDEATAALTLLAEHPEHLPGARQDTTYGVPVGDTGIIMSTYDGTARKFTRWVLQGPWKETT